MWEDTKVSNLRSKQNNGVLPSLGTLGQTDEDMNMHAELQITVHDQRDNEVATQDY